MRAPANAPVVHGDKERPELTRQYNEGYKVDLAEPHAGPAEAEAEAAQTAAQAVAQAAAELAANAQAAAQAQEAALSSLRQL